MLLWQYSTSLINLIVDVYDAVTHKHKWLTYRIINCSRYQECWYCLARRRRTAFFCTSSHTERLDDWETWVLDRKAATIDLKLKDIFGRILCSFDRHDFVRDAESLYTFKCRRALCDEFLMFKGKGPDNIVEEHTKTEKDSRYI